MEGSSVGTAAQLMGYWLSGPLESGLMEDSELGLLADGHGWYALASFGGGLTVTRFRWHCPRPNELELREEWSLDGTWTLDGGISQASAPEPSGLVLRTGFQLAREPDPSGTYLTVLRLVEPVAYCVRYALSPRDPGRWRDPSYPLVPYPEP